MSMTRFLSAALLAGASLVPDSFAVAQAPLAPDADAPPPEFITPPRARRRLQIFIPPIGRFGGFSADIGRGNVNVNVGPSGGGFGGPAFGGVNVSVFRPAPIEGPAVVYGPGVAEFAPSARRHVIVTIPNPFLGCVGGDGEVVPFQPLNDSGDATNPDLGAPTLSAPYDPNSALPPEVSPRQPRDNRGLDSLLPELPPGAATPRTTNKPATEVPETVVPKRSTGDKKVDGPVLPELPPQSSLEPAPRLFPTRGPRLLPAGFIPDNGFDVDRGPRPNAPVRPGNDPFGPRFPRPEAQPAT
jgi:hypothetical protein